ncbi:MAG: TlyA family RNA methyltransferase [Chloroflexi bacterium]|nr:TlyA family RNA methyltransferase [Chloroflexota bacterium]
MSNRPRRRADILLVELGLAPTRVRAQALILEGRVYCGEQPVPKPSSLLPAGAPLRVTEGARYVSRGGLKLEAALRHFALDVAGRVALDVGASTGGFTDCLLQHGARRVYAVDVGYGQMASTLRTDPRVVVMERVNARYPFPLTEQVDLVTADVSFISLTLVLPPSLEHLRPGGHVVALVKPQFEAGRKEVGRGGVVRDPNMHAAVLARFVRWAIEQGLRVRGVISSPITGDAGNREFLVLLQKRV